MIDIVDILGSLSKQFQADDLFITDIVTKLGVSQMKMEQLKLGEGKNYKKFLANYDPSTGVLKCGKTCEQSITLKKTNVDLTGLFAKMVDAFMTYIDNRFGKLQQAPFSQFMVFDPSTLPSNRKDLLLHGNDAIESLVEFYSGMLSPEERDGAVDQWSDLKLRLQHNKHLKPQDYYANLLMAAPSALKDILVLVQIMMTLSPTTAKLERSFSAMKASKTVIRNRMDAETLQMTMRINDSGKQKGSYDPAEALQNWLGHGQGIRHVVNNPSAKIPDKVETRGRVSSFVSEVPSLQQDYVEDQPDDSIIEVTSF